MCAGSHAPSRLAAMLVLAGLVLAGCGDGAPERRPAATSTAAGSAARPSHPRPARGGAAWTRKKVLRRIAGRRIRVQGRIVRVDPDTITCGGVGRAAGSVEGKGAWSRFRCVQPTFPAGAVVGPDAIFFVEPRDARSVEFTASRFTRY
jgi:hypothetical protein